MGDATGSTAAYEAPARQVANVVGTGGAVRLVTLSADGTQVQAIDLDPATGAQRQVHRVALGRLVDTLRLNTTADGLAVFDP